MKQAETVNCDYLIPKFEELAELARQLRDRVHNPEPDRLLSEHCELQDQLSEFMKDGKITTYLRAKEVIEGGFELMLKKDYICFHNPDDWSDAGHPEIYYLYESGFGSMPITTSRSSKFEFLEPKEFMEKTMSGNYITQR